MFPGIVLYVLLALFSPVLVVGVIAYLIVRRRDGGNGVTAHEALMAYFYFVIAVSVIVAAVGGSYLFSVGLSEAYDSSGKIADDIKLGLTLLGTSSLVCILHIYARRAFESGQAKAMATIRRVFLFFMLAVFSIVGLVTLPLAIYATVDHYIDDSSENEEASDYYDYDDDYWGADNGNDPSQEIAAALIGVPMWAYYGFRVIREVRRKSEVAHLAA